MVSRETRRVETTKRQAALLVAIPLVVLFLLGEAAGRLLEMYAGYMPRRTSGFNRANPYLRSALIPDIHYESGPIRVRVNPYGFRGRDFDVPKEPGTFRIFAIGESSTFGWKGVASHRQAWPARLEAKLRAAYPDRAIEVVNAGVPGTTSVEQRVNYMLRISRLEPDALLLYHGNNDINWSWVPDVETKLIYGRSVVGPPNTSLWNRLLEHSYVYTHLRSLLLRSTRGDRVKRDEVDPDALRMLEDNLRSLVADGRRDGVKVAIATFAHGLDERRGPAPSRRRR